MKIVELPGDVMDATENVKLTIKELHRVPVALWRHIAFSLKLVILEVRQTELPQVLHPVLGVLASEDVGTLAVSRRCASAPWHWHTVVFYLRPCLLSPALVPGNSVLTLFLVMLYS
jgi:hypothetical protein